MTQKIYADAATVRDLVGGSQADQLSDEMINTACKFGSSMADQSSFRNNVPDEDDQYPLFKQAAELFASVVILKRFGAERRDDAKANLDMATQICTAIAAASEGEPDATTGEQTFDTTAIAPEYTTYPASRNGEYFGMRRPRSAFGYIFNDPHHEEYLPE